MNQPLAPGKLRSWFIGFPGSARSKRKRCATGFTASRNDRIAAVGTAANRENEQERQNINVDHGSSVMAVYYFCLQRFDEMD
jgi:hypothetical protein